MGGGWGIARMNVKHRICPHFNDTPKFPCASCQSVLYFYPYHAAVPTISVAQKSLLSSTRTVSFAHPDSYPGLDSPLRQELKYEVMSKNGVERCPSTTNSIAVQKGLATSFKVKVFYGDGRWKDLGQIYCDTCKQSKPKMTLISRDLWGLGMIEFKCVPTTGR